MSGLKVIPSKIRSEFPKTIEEVEKLPLHLVLILIGGSLSILFSLVYFFYAIFSKNPIGGSVVSFFMLLLGGVVLLSYIITKKYILKGAIIGCIVSLLLILVGSVGGVGGIGGVVSGIISLCGFGAALLKGIKFI